MSKKLIAYVAAHSGGHIIPALTHSHKQLQQKACDEILFFTSNKPLDIKLIRHYKQEGVKQVLLPLTSSPTQILRYFHFTIQLLNSFFIALWHLLWHKPEKIISMGGILSIPVCIAGKLLGIPYELYELNVQPGKAVKLLSQWSQNLYICFDQTMQLLPDIPCKKTEYPLRYHSHRLVDKKIILEAFGFSDSRLTLLIIGGSQGSVFINQLIKNWVSTYQKKQQLQIIHQTGTQDTFDYKRWYIAHAIPAIVFDYVDDLAFYYQIADYAIGRAGAGIIAEMQFFKIKSLLIPLITKNTYHQQANAQAANLQFPHIFQWTNQKPAEKLYPYISSLIGSKKLSLND